jgi:hypothetical protein
LKTYNFWVMLVCEGDSQYMARTTTLTPEEQAEKRRAYQREYAKTHRKERVESQIKWAKANPEKIKAYNKTYEAKGRKKDIVVASVHMSKNKEQEMIEYLSGIGSVNAYLKRLIQEDMNRNKYKEDK